MKVVCKRLSVYVFCNATLLFGFALFLKCYFPLKQGLEGFASSDTLPHEPYTGRTGLPKSSFQRIVLLVIDALRTDFVLGDRMYMPFTQRLLKDGRGVAFHAKTHLPTVTLPRIKSITSGSIPGFVDVVMNFGSAAFTEDNIVTQLKLAGKKLLFFGDDTWLRLFPGHFFRAEGTTSFFVTDYTEVDNNVTRHLSGELVQGDWDGLILHYLGLDHIGHLYGPTSDLVAPKLLEMDAVVKQIYSAITTLRRDKATLLVICGDHGMSDQGGHGGASTWETTVPALFITPHVQFAVPAGKTLTMQQIDLCPTLSALLGMPIPRNNLGLVVTAALPVDTVFPDRVRCLQLNAAQMVDVWKTIVDSLETDSMYQQYQMTVLDHGKWLASDGTESAANWESEGSRLLLEYQDVIHRMSQRISQTSTCFDLYGIFIAIVLIWMILLLQVSLPASSIISVRLEGQNLVQWMLLLLASVLCHLTVCTSRQSSETLCALTTFSLLLQAVSFFLLMTACVLLANVLPVAFTEFFQVKTVKVKCSERWPQICLSVFILLHALSLMSSSFVEEEHQTWYFFSTSFIIFVFLHASGRAAKALVGVHADCSSNYDRADKKLEKNVEMMPPVSDGCNPHIKAGAKDLTTIGGLLGMLALLRIVRRWNQTGNKWLDIADVGDWLVRQENKQYLTCLVVISLLGLGLVRLGSMPRYTSRVMIGVALTAVYLFRAASGALHLPRGLAAISSLQGVYEARIAYLCASFFLLHTLWQRVRKYEIDSDDKTGPYAGDREARHSLYSSDGHNACTLKLAHQHGSGHDTSYRQTLAKSGSSGSDASQTVVGRESRSDKDTSYHQQVVETLSEPKQHKSHFLRSLFEDVAVWEAGQTFWLCVMCLLLRPHNIALVFVVAVMERLVYKCVLPFLASCPTTIFLFCLMMGQTSFFLQGNSNSLSTVDVSASMTALYNYQPVVSGLQLWVATYCTFIYWLLSAGTYLCSVSTNSRQLSAALHDLVGAALLSRTLPVAVYIVLVTLMRHHLFVWTVFSPKLLYEGTQTVVVCVFCAACISLVRHSK